MKNITLIVLFFVIILILPKVIAQTDPSDTSQTLGETFGVNASKIPSSQEDIETIRQKYLQQQWTEFISKNKVLGPIHRFFTRTSIVFKILFAHPYEISLTLFGIVVLWFLLGAQAAKVIENSGIIRSGWIALVIGLMFAIILAQIRLIQTIVTFILDLIFKQENWWIRLILIVIIIGLAVIEVKLSQMLSKRLEETKKRKEEEETGQKLEEIKSLGRGIKKFN